VELSSPQEGRPLQLDGLAYRGEIRIDLQPGSRLRVVNTVEVESYLRGVVPNEMFADDEAYRVQAIIARTYALYVRDLEKKHHPDGFDICTTGHCQVYRGLDSETPRSNEAVAATRGLVLTRQGSVIFSAYHSNAGGRTVEVDEAWPGSIRESFRYLPQVESPYDEEARRLPGYEWCWEWRRTVTPAALAIRLGAKGKALGEVRDLLVLRRNRAGRVAALGVIGARGNLEIVGPPQIRVALDAPSARFEISRSADGFQLHGWGYGDGVGLSQHGALGMARAGYAYESILAHYYRGVEITEEYGAGPARPLRVEGLRPRQTTARDDDRS
jgi:stage II sporulation protein D